MTPSHRKPLRPRDPCMKRKRNEEYFITSNNKASSDRIFQVVNKNVTKINAEIIENDDKTMIGDDRWSRLGARPKIRSRTLTTIFE